MKYTRFTAKDDDVIKNIIEQHDKLTEAFEDAAIALDRSPSSIRNRYYTAKAFKAKVDARRKEETKRRYSVTKTLVKEIQNNPNNLQEAFRRTAAKTNLSPTTLENNYYSENSYCNRSNIGVCFTLISGDKVIHNGKNTETNQPKVWKDKSNSLLNFFRNIFHNVWDR